MCGCGALNNAKPILCGHQEMAENIRMEDHRRQNAYTPPRPSMPLKTRTVPDENVEEEDINDTDYAEIGKQVF